MEKLHKSYKITWKYSCMEGESLSVNASLKLLKAIADSHGWKSGFMSAPPGIKAMDVVRKMMQNGYTLAQIEERYLG